MAWGDFDREQAERLQDEAAKKQRDAFEQVFIAFKTVKGEDDVIAAAVKEIQVLIDASPAGRELKRLAEQRKATVASCAAAEKAVKDAALQVFGMEFDKHVAPGVEIRDFPKVKYDADKALAWALAHQPKLAKLDARAFEQVVLANAGGPVEIVPADVAEVVVEHRVFITASKL